MCAECEAVTLRREASAALLQVCEQKFGIGEAIKAAFPVEQPIPPDLRRFLDRL